MPKLATIARALIALLASCLLLAVTACDDGGGDDGEGGDPDGGDSDVDSDTGECSAVEWGSGLKIGEKVSNWAMSGYIDNDGDGVVEELEVDYDFELIHCTGKQSMVLIYGDTS